MSGNDFSCGKGCCCNRCKGTIGFWGGSSQGNVQIITATSPQLASPNGGQLVITFILHKFPNAQAAFLQMREWTGRVIADTLAINFDVNIPFAPCDSIGQVMQLVLNGGGIQGFMKLGGGRGPRLYKSTGYSGGFSGSQFQYGWDGGWNYNRCGSMFKAGDLLNAQGFSLIWNLN